MKNTTAKIGDTADLRNFLLGQMIGVSDGEVTHDQARSICNIAQQVHNTLAIEIKVARAAVEAGSEGGLPPVVFRK